MKRITTLLAAFCLLCTTLARAADDPQSVSATVAPYLDDGTLAVVHADLSRVDLRPLQQAVTETIRSLALPPAQVEANVNGINQAVQGIGGWTTEFTKAGGRDVYVIVSANELPGPGIYGVVPLKPGADATTIQRLLKDMLPQQPAIGMEVRDGILVWGSASALNRLATPKAQNRPELAKAFEAAGDSAIQLLFAPSPDARKVLADVLPPLPPELAGDSDEPLAQRVSWMAVGVNLTPAPTLNLVLQAPDEKAATSLAQTVNAALASARQLLEKLLPNQPGVAKALGDLTALGKALTPTRTGDRLTLRLDAGPSLKLSSLLAPAMAKARSRAAIEQSANNVRQIVMASTMNANDNKGQFPPDLKTVLKTQDVSPTVLVNPLRPNQEIGYVYLRPTRGSNAPSNHVVVYEAYDAPPDHINVGFIDGHVEYVDFPRFEKLLADSTARNAAK